MSDNGILNDPRVSRSGPFFVGDSDHYAVRSDDGNIWGVQAVNGSAEWWAVHEIGPRAMRDANLRDQDDAEAFLERTKVGPFAYAVDAIRHLLHGGAR